MTIIPVPVANLQFTVTAIGAVAGVLYVIFGQLAPWLLDRIAEGFLALREPASDASTVTERRRLTAIRGGTHAPSLGVIRSGGRGAGLRRVDSRGRL